MLNVLITCVSFLLVLGGSCGNRSQTPPKTHWSLQLITSGGFAGIGRGNFSVNDEGAFVCLEMNRQDVRKGLTGTLYPRQLQPISDAVAVVKVDGWNNQELNVAAPDAFGYKLELRTGANSEHAATAQWYDNTSDKLPPDLKKLSDVFLETMDSICHNKGYAGP